MVYGAVRNLFQLLGVLVVGLLIALPVLAWRLSNGPVRLDFLTPYIEQALAGDEFSVKLESTVLAFRDGEGLLEIRAVGVRAFSGGETPIATVPEIAMTLNGRALLGGVIAPKSVRLVRPTVTLVRNEDGRLQWAIGENAEDGGSQQGESHDVARQLIDSLVGLPDPSQPGRHLQRAAVVGADLQVVDKALGVSWHAPEVDLELRRTDQGLFASARLKLDLAGESGAISGDVTYLREGDWFDGVLSVTGIRPASLARLGGPLTQLNIVDMPLAGTVRAKGKVSGQLSEVWLDLSGGAGELNLPDPVNLRRPVGGVAIRGGVFDDFKRARLDEFFLDLGGPTLTLSAVADGLGGETLIKADAVLREVPFDLLPQLWPEAMAPNPREWVTKNLSAGIAHEARATISARSASGSFDDVVVEHVDGGLEGDGVTVDYLHPMPVVKNAAASATFDASAFRISVKGGEVYGLRIKDGVIVLGGLDKVDQDADINLTIAGPAADALKLIDHQPLRYAQALGISPNSVGGDGTTRLHLKFPLLKDLRLDDLSIKAHSSLKGVSIPKVVMGLDLTQGDLELDVDAKGLDATGPVVLGTIPAELKWRENFSTKGVPFRSRYTLKAPAVDEAQRKLLGLDGVPFVSPFLSGPVGADVVATLFGGGKGDIEAKVDLSPARMSLLGMGWRKEDRTTGGARVLVRLEKMKLASVPRFEVQAGDLNTRGSVAFNPDGSARKVEFERLAYGRTDVSGSLSLRPGGGMDVAFKGSSFDADPLIGTDEEDDAPVAQNGKKARKKSDLPPMSVTGSVATLWTSPKGGLTSASVHLSRDGQDWRVMTIKGTVGAGKGFVAELRPAGPHRRDVKVLSDDAGSVAKAFNVYDNLVGGKLEIEGHYDDTQESQPFIGKVRVTDYSVVNAPALARLLTVAALTGVVDLLNGDGVTFTTLDAPFTLSEGLLTVKEARAYGPALGITAKGELDLDASRMALEGTVVPAYALNSVLGNIPLLGWLVTGGEKGGGLVAFNYTMKGPSHEPDVVVNPLSALTPGFLRNLFNIFDDGSETEARKKPAPPRQ